LNFISIRFNGGLMMTIFEFVNLQFYTLYIFFYSYVHTGHLYCLLFVIYTKKINIYIKIYYLLTPWCRVLLEKLTGLQLVKKSY